MVDTPLVPITSLTPLGSATGCVIPAYNTGLDTWVVLIPDALRGVPGLKGEKGDKGDKGDLGSPGSAGTPGNGWVYGNGAPLNTFGRNGDWYIDQVNLYIYGPKVDGAWPTGGRPLVGPPGPKGEPGTAGTGSGDGSALVVAGTIDGQQPRWDGTTGKYQPVSPVAITANRDQTTELNVPTALTFNLHNGRQLTLIAAAALTLAASEAGEAPYQGFGCVIDNDYSAVQTLTFGAGLVVKQPATGTGTGQQVKIAVDGTVIVRVYPSNGTLIAKVKGDVA